MSDPHRRMRYRLVSGGRPRDAVSDQPLRLGYGRDCELALDGVDGPPVLFEVRHSAGPLQIATRVPPEELAHYVELSVDGSPLDEPFRALGRGSRIEVLDKSSQRRYELVLDPPSRWRVRPRFLAAIMVVLTALGAAYGAYVYSELESTRDTLTRAASRLDRTEAGVRETQRQLASAQGRVEHALAELAAERRAADAVLREELGGRVDELARRGRAALDQMSERDVKGRATLRIDLEAQLESLRDEFASRMVESFQRFKSLEREMLDAVAARVEAFEPDSARFKRVLATARQASLFVHTRYVIEYAGGEERQTFDSFGTGFVVSADGLAMTAQHVLFPWRYERELLVLSELGAVRVVEAETRWAAWPTGTRAMKEGGDATELDLDDAYVSGGETPTLHFLHAPTPASGEELVPTPVGVVRITVPTPGGTDVAVFRLTGHDDDLEHLTVGEPSTTLEPLDDLLVVGYPFSRLVDGIASPQAVRGLVRRLGAGVVEVDIPLHPGLSGAPLIDSNGTVVGMASATYGSAAYGFAAPLRSLVDALRAAEGRPPVVE